MSYIFFPSPTPVFPALSVQGWSFMKTPSFTSTNTKSASGKEFNLIRSVYPRWEFTLNYSGDSWLRDQTQNIIIYGPLAGHYELEKLSGLFLQCLGDYGEFYFNDPDDNSRAGYVAGVMPYPPAAATFPLYFQWGVGPFTPPMMLPVQGIQTIDKVTATIGGTVTVLNPGTDYTVDATNTQLVVNTTSYATATITVDFHFYYRCRFLSPFEEYEEWATNLWENKELKFQSVKP